MDVAVQERGDHGKLQAHLLRDGCESLRCSRAQELSQRDQQMRDGVPEIGAGRV